MRCLIWLGLVTVGTFAQQSTGSTLSEYPVEEYVDRGPGGSYKFGFRNLDTGSHYHVSAASRQNTVAGRFGSYDPASRRIIETKYTAGNRGFRARGPNIVRQMDLSQSKIPYQPLVPQDSPDYQPSYSGYYDPNNDPSYKYSLKTPTASRDESADSVGTVRGAYSFVDDVGKRHDVQYEAGATIGFHVKNPFPDSELFGGLFYQGPNKPGTRARGHSSIVHGTDGSYRFVASGPDQKRVEFSDSKGRVRGSYTYIDNKGVQRTVQYIAGPNIGYKVIGKGSSPMYSPIYPFPGSDLSALPLNAENALLPDFSNTTQTPTFANNLFERPANDFSVDITIPENDQPFIDTSDISGTTNKPFITSTHRPDLNSGRPKYWLSSPVLPFYTTFYPPKLGVQNFYSDLNSGYKPESQDGSERAYRPQSKPFYDLFGDGKPLGSEKSMNEHKSSSNKNYTENSSNRPSTPSYDNLYPSPDKGLVEEPEKGFSTSPNDTRYTKTNRNLLGLPPGLIVRAHVQSLDILPYGSKISPPDETLQRHLLEELRRNRKYELKTRITCS